MGTWEGTMSDPATRPPLMSSHSQGVTPLRQGHGGRQRRGAAGEALRGIWAEQAGPTGQPMHGLMEAGSSAHLP